MKIIILLLVSLIEHSLGDVLHVKCGDEKCEKPSNRAVTTLRYTPDKPYKLQINVVNAEVEIYGATEDLYYIRHGRNYGFLPKNHLREKARGKFHHPVEIDIGLYKINQEVRETNFIHEFLMSSHTSTPTSDTHSHSTDVANDTVEIKNEIKNNVEEERPKEYIPLGLEPKLETLPAEPIPTTTQSTNDIKVESDNANKSEEENDSGIEDEEDDEGDEGDEDDEDDIEEVFDKEEKNEPAKIIEVKPASLDIDIAENDLNNSIPLDTKESTTSQPTEEVKSELITDADVKVKSNSDNVDVSEKIEEIPAVINEVEEKKEDIKVVDDLLVSNITETDINSENTPKIEEPVITTTESPNMDILPPPSLDNNIETTTESNIPNLLDNSTDFINEIPQDTTTVTPLPPVDELTLPNSQEELTTTPEPKQEETTTPEPKQEETTTPEPKQEETTTPEPKQEETTPPTLPPLDLRPNDDILLKKFDEKLTQKSDGVGSVEQVHSHFNHFHDHSHNAPSHDHSHHVHSNDHSHHSHSHDHHHHYDHENVEKIEENVNNVDSPILPSDEDVDKKPGFLGNLFKKIFGESKEEKLIFEEALQSDEKNVDNAFCEKLDSENCPNSLKSVHYRATTDKENVNIEKTFVKYLNLFMAEAVEKMDLIISLALTAFTTLIFIFGYYCVCRTKKEGPLIARMNELERHLMASGKENEMLKAEIISTKQKLTSIEDNSFGSNDMVIALKQELEDSERIKNEFAEKISSLEKELEAAAEDGLELNKMVSELLSTQTGSESIISSVEDLQRQLNEQQETIFTMNETLAAKSRENTELQIQLSEISSKFHESMELLQQQIDALTLERSNLQLELENVKRESDIQINQIVEERNSEVTRLNNELTSYAGKYDDNRKLLNTAEAKVQALEECIENMKKSNKGGDFKNILDVADLKADLLAVTKEKSTQQEQLQTERDAKKLLEDRVKIISEEMSSLKKEFGVAEKEKLEAQTRLDVLSAYFKETETRLQLELSEEKARGMKQQGETMSTVEKVQALNDEIQALKSQNDSLRAEIEAQVSAHKLNISSIEAQAHSAWLNARQAERKLEESRMEAAALRRRLTSIAENPSANTTSDLLNGLPGNDSMNSMSSPQRVESPNMNSMPGMNPMNPMGPLPPGVPFLPGAPPFIPPFMLPNPGQGVLPGLPPLGRLMSPPPKRFTPTDRDRRYSPRNRGRYSPDSRYDDYTAFETETDYSPPPSPRRGYISPSDRSKKGGHSSGGSVDSSNKPSRRK